MGDPPGKNAQGFKLLEIQKLSLRFLALRNVPDDPHRVPRARQCNCRRGHFDGKLRSVFPQRRKFQGIPDGRPLACPAEVFESPAVRLVERSRGKQKVQLLADGLFTHVSEHGFRGIVPEGDVSPLVHHDDRIRRSRRDGAEFYLTILKRLERLISIRATTVPESYSE